MLENIERYLNQHRFSQQLTLIFHNNTWLACIEVLYKQEWPHCVEGQSVEEVLNNLNIKLGEHHESK